MRLTENDMSLTKPCKQTTAEMRHGGEKKRERELKMMARSQMNTSK